MELKLLLLIYYQNQNHHKNNSKMYKIILFRNSNNVMKMPSKENTYFSILTKKLKVMEVVINKLNFSLKTI